MCTDYADLRAKISRRADAVLTAKAGASKKDKSELVREILDAWAEEELHAATVMHRLLRTEGLVGES